MNFPDAHRGLDLLDHLDLMFGVGRRRIMTGDHVEVWREPPTGEDRLPYFRKRFVAQRGPHAIDWNLREALLILTLDELGSAHLQQFDSTSHTQDRTQRDLRTQHAGPSLQNWLDLPVRRDDRRLAHAFHDCAHWFALARYGLTALRDINAAGVLHLDIKPDNICIPTDPPFFDPHSGDGFSVALPRLRLIDFAFSLWESKLPLGRALGMGIYESTEYQSRQLRSAIAAGERDDLGPIRQLDWRADLYGLGWTLEFILADLPAPGSEGAPGWNASRLEQARRLIRQLLAFDEMWRDQPAVRLPAPPHQELMDRIDGVLAAADLQRSLTLPWQLIRDESWKSRELVTPLTIPAIDLRFPDPPAMQDSGHKPDPHVSRPKTKWLVLAALLLAAAAAAYFAGLPMWSPSLDQLHSVESPRSTQVIPATPQPDPAKAKSPSPAIEPPLAKPAPTPALRAAPPVSVPTTAPSVTVPAAAAPSPPPAPAAHPAPTPPSNAQLAERLATGLRDSSPSRFAAVLSSVDIYQDSFTEVQKAAADTLVQRWNSLPPGDQKRGANLQALLWLLKQLPDAPRQQVKAALGDRYWTIAAAEGERDWWRHRASPDAEGRAWLAEAAQLAGAGIHQAMHTLAHANAIGLGVPQDSALAGQRLSQALGGISSESLRSARAWRAAHAAEAGHDENPAAADAVIVELAVKLVSWRALSNADRRFSAAAVPGLKHLADFGEPAAATMLGDIYACRMDPPMKREARAAYSIAQKDPAWARIIPRRMADVIDGRACAFKLARRARAP